MTEYRVSVWLAAAVVLWSLSVATIAASFAWASVANVGLLLAVAAMTVTVRYWIGRSLGQLKNLFDVGRDVGRAEAEGVRRVH